jgi:uncharacterized Zn finger protein
MSKRITRHTKSLSAKGKTHEVTEIARGLFEVVSGSSGKVYTVDLGGQAPSCTCDWGSWRKRGQAAACSHTLAVLAHIAAQEAKATSAWANESDARRQKRHIDRRLTSDGVWVTERR